MMSETPDYIESYFENGLTAGERMQFEQRITTDAAFAGEVAFYIQTRQVVRRELVQEKETIWKGAPVVATEQASVVQLKRPVAVRRRLVAAASVVVLLGLSLVFLLNRNSGSTSPVSAKQLAQQYTDSAFKRLEGTTMGNRDDFQKGIATYNNHFADSAEHIFSRVYQQDTANFKALEYSGLAALNSRHYDQAIEKFQQLAKSDDYAANPALFYEAITRLQRNGISDMVEAKRLLQWVRDSNLPEWTKQKADQFLDHFNQ